MTKTLLILLMLFLSGGKNAAYYKDKNWLCYLLTICTAAVVMWYGFQFGDNWPYFAIPAFWVLAMLFPFIQERTDLVHAMENVWKIVFWVVAVLCGAGIINLSLALVFGNIIFNIPIQLSDKGKLFSEATTEKIHIGDFTYEKKRVGLVVELTCGALLILNYFLNIDFTIKQLL